MFLNSTHACISLHHSFCMVFQEHLFPFLLQPSACTLLCYKGQRDYTCEGARLHLHYHLLSLTMSFSGVEDSAEWSALTSDEPSSLF